jgi:hypothetical protein
VQVDPAVLLEKLKRDVRELKQELSMHDTLAGRHHIIYDPYTPEQQVNAMPHDTHAHYQSPVRCLTLSCAPVLVCSLCLHAHAIG